VKEAFLFNITCARVRSRNPQPVLSNECNVSGSRKQQ